MNARHALGALLLMAVSTAAAACDLPPLIAVPAAENVGDDAGRLIGAMQRYVSGIRAYSACVQAEIAAAGGDAAPESLRSTLVRRNNAAVAEARAVVALFVERVAPIEELYLAEFLPDGGEDCIEKFRLDKTGVVDDRAVLFIDRAGRTYLNVLEQACADLARFGHFDVRTTIVGAASPELGPVRTMRLCGDEFILPYAFEGQPLRNRECALGRFFELSQEQAVRLMELRNAVQQRAQESAQRQEEETPTRPRNER